MTEEERREIHELVAKVSDGNQSAATALEERVLAFERARATEDSVYVLDRLRLLGLSDAHERIAAVLTHNRLAHPDDRPPWIG